jgi:hypothetical protein
MPAGIPGHAPGLGRYSIRARVGTTVVATICRMDFDIEGDEVRDRVVNRIAECALSEYGSAEILDQISDTN